MASKGAPSGRFSGRAWSWRVTWPLVPVAVVNAAAVGVVAVVVWLLVLVVVARLARRWAAVEVGDDAVVVSSRFGGRTVVPCSSVTGVRVLQVGGNRLVPVLDRGDEPPLRVTGAQEFLGQASLLQPGAWAGRADRFARVAAEACGLEALDHEPGADGDTP